MIDCFAKGSASNTNRSSFTPLGSVGVTIAPAVVVRDLLHSLVVGQIKVRIGVHLSTNATLNAWIAGLPAENRASRRRLSDAAGSIGMSEYSTICVRPSISTNSPTFSLGVRLGQHLRGHLAS